MLKGAARVSHHGWNFLQGYFNAHDKRIADLSDEGLIVENSVSRRWSSEKLMSSRVAGAASTACSSMS
jgi:hypothetical protein